MNKNNIKFSLIILIIATGLGLWLYKDGGVFGLHKNDSEDIKTGIGIDNDVNGNSSYKDERYHINRNYLEFEGSDVIIPKNLVSLRDEYKEYKRINKDLVGIVDIEGLDFKYPVMMSSIPNYYLNHDLFNKYSLFGCPYMGEGYSIINNNIVIYGHCINKDKMFGKLLALKNKRTLDRIKRVYLYTECKIYEYEVIALLSLNVANTKFRYWEIKKFINQEEFEEYADGIIENGIYVKKDKLKYGDYIMLSTCDNELGEDYRIVLVGRKCE